MAVVLSAGCVATSGADQTRDETAEASSPPPATDTESFTGVESKDEYELGYRWGVGDRSFELQTTVTKDAYRWARSRSRSIPECCRDALASGITRAVADALVVELSNLDSPRERLLAVARFVQSREYRLDAVATGYREYPKYVAETLIENGGDCEDLAVLLVGLFSALPDAYGPVLLFFDDHVGVGLDVRQVGTVADAMADPLVVAGEQSYLYVESTAELPVGIVPEPYDDRDVLAVFDGGWRHVDAGALGAQARQALADGAFVDPRLYL